jgi:hypothetical protein
MTKNNSNWLNIENTPYFNTINLKFSGIIVSNKILIIGLVTGFFAIITIGILITKNE